MNSNYSNIDTKCNNGLTVKRYATNYKPVPYQCLYGRRESVEDDRSLESNSKVERLQDCVDVTPICVLNEYTCPNPYERCKRYDKPMEAFRNAESKFYEDTTRFRNDMIRNFVDRKNREVRRLNLIPKYFGKV